MGIFYSQTELFKEKNLTLKRRCCREVQGSEPMETENSLQSETRVDSSEASMEGWHRNPKQITSQCARERPSHKLIPVSSGKGKQLVGGGAQPNGKRNTDKNPLVEDRRETTKRHEERPDERQEGSPRYNPRHRERPGRSQIEKDRYPEFSQGLRLGEERREGSPNLTQGSFSEEGNCERYTVPGRREQCTAGKSTGDFCHSKSKEVYSKSQKRQPQSYNYRYPEGNAHFPVTKVLSEGKKKFYLTPDCSQERFLGKSCLEDRHVTHNSQAEEDSLYPCTYQELCARESNTYGKHPDSSSWLGEGNTLTEAERFSQQAEEFSPRDTEGESDPMQWDSYQPPEPEVYMDCSYMVSDNVKSLC